MSAATEQDLVAELRLLAEALLDRVEPWLTDTAAADRVDDAATTPCGWCPLCALAAALRGERPELARRVAEQGAGVLGALRAALEQHAAHPHAPHPGPQPGPAESTPVVQRIPVRRPGAAPGSMS